MTTIHTIIGTIEQLLSVQRLIAELSVPEQEFGEVDRDNASVALGYLADLMDQAHEELHHAMIMHEGKVRTEARQDAEEERELEDLEYNSPPRANGVRESVRHQRTPIRPADQRIPIR